MELKHKENHLQRVQNLEANIMKLEAKQTNLIVADRKHNERSKSLGGFSSQLNTMTQELRDIELTCAAGNIGSDHTYR